MADVDAILRRHDASVAVRGNWDSLCQEIADRVWPQMADFQTVERSEGDKRTERMYDATPALALQKFAAAVESFSTPRNQRWNKLATTDDALNRSQAVKAYLDDVNNLLYRVRYSPRAAFATQTHEVYTSFGAFGSGVMLIEDDPAAAQIRYKSVSMAGLSMLENQHGSVDTLFRLFKQTLRQIVQRFGLDALPERLRGKFERSPDDRIDVLHYIAPNEDYMRGRIGPRGQPWQSCWIIPGERHLLRKSGYAGQPFVVCRYMTAPNEVMGRSPAWLALSNIKVLNEQKKTLLKAAHKAVDPPLLAADDGILGVYSQVPGAVNFGGLNAQGEAMVKPLFTGARLDIGLDMMDKEREIINDAFLVTLFQILVETPTMTATEVMERAQEKATLLAPVIGRIQSEMLGPLIEREIQILADAGQLPPMPDELLEAEGEYRIEYTSPMAKAMRASEGVAIIRTLESVTALAQVRPDVLDTFDLDEAARELADINGVPAKIVREREAVRAMKEDRAQQEQAAALLQAAPVATEAAKNLIGLQKAYGQPTAA